MANLKYTEHLSNNSMFTFILLIPEIVPMFQNVQQMRAEPLASFGKNPEKGEFENDLNINISELLTFPATRRSMRVGVSEPRQGSFFIFPD